jgi:hypothetical protein
VGGAYKRPCDTAFCVFQILPPEIANLDHADRAARAKAAAERAAASQAGARSEQCKNCKVRNREHLPGCALANDQFAPGAKADAGAVVGRKRGRREDEQLLALGRESAEMRELRKRRLASCWGSGLGAIWRRRRGMRGSWGSGDGEGVPADEGMLEKRQQEAK